MRNDSNSLAIQNTNPYDVIHNALNALTAGDYSGALLLLGTASGFVGRFYPSGSVKDNNLKQTIEFFRYILDNHPEEFRELMVNDVQNNIELNYKPR